MNITIQWISALLLIGLGCCRLVQNSEQVWGRSQGIAMWNEAKAKYSPDKWVKFIHFVPYLTPWSHVLVTQVPGLPSDLWLWLEDPSHALGQKGHR